MIETYINISCRDTSDESQWVVWTSFPVLLPSCLCASKLVALPVIVSVPVLVSSKSLPVLLPTHSPSSPHRQAFYLLSISLWPQPGSGFFVNPRFPFLYLFCSQLTAWKGKFGWYLTFTHWFMTWSLHSLATSVCRVAHIALGVEYRMDIKAVTDINMQIKGQA